MKAQIFLIPIFLFSSLFYACDMIKVDSLKPVFIAVAPSKPIRNVNGLLFKYFDQEESFIPKKVNGLGMGFNPLGLFFPALLIVYLPGADRWSLNNDYGVVPENKMNKINGVQLSLINMEPTVTNGLEVNISSNINTYAIINGLAISPILNFHHEIKGVSVAPLANVGQKCRGLQIGLYNSCKDFRGVQIGGWNENGKRKLPFINWNFKKQKNNE